MLTAVRRACGAAVTFACLAMASVSGAQQVKKPADPNQKICQVITPVGSRLATKKVCATRAEWDARKKDDREIVEKVQTQRCMSAADGLC